MQGPAFHSAKRKSERSAPVQAPRLEGLSQHHQPDAATMRRRVELKASRQLGKAPGPPEAADPSEPEPVKRCAEAPCESAVDGSAHQLPGVAVREFRGRFAQLAIGCRRGAWPACIGRQAVLLTRAEAHHTMRGAARPWPINQQPV